MNNLRSHLKAVGKPPIQAPIAGGGAAAQGNAMPQFGGGAISNSGALSSDGN